MVADVFTSNPLEGNQLAVFLDGRPFSSDEMQLLARELKLAETVFVLPPENGGHARIRIFTPGSEQPFAGHPVLGTAFVVGQALGVEHVALETAARQVSIVLERDGGRIVFGRLTQGPPKWEPYEHEREVLQALGLESSVLPVEIYYNGPPHVYVGLESKDAVAAVKPDINALTELNIAANCFAGEGQSWKNRMFYPAAGVFEDPATGSAAGPLAIHLARHGKIAFGDQIEITQGVEIDRPSRLYATARGDADSIDSVEVGGNALIVAEGHYRIARP